MLGSIPAAPTARRAALILARRAALALVLVCIAAAGAHAQDSHASQPSTQPQPSPTPQANSSAPASEQHFFGNILRDQRAIWTSPFHAGRGDARWLAPLGASAVVLFATDRRTAGEEAEGGLDPVRVRVSRAVSQGGAFYTTGAASAFFYLAGRAGHNARERETGVLGLEALADSLVVVEALKAVAERSRPIADNASGEFFSGGKSFPSGHAISAWSFATVVANEYKDRRLVQVGAYGLATAVSVSRFTARKHFLSDVLIGSALGYGIGRYVYSKRHDPALDANSLTKTDGDAESGEASESNDGSETVEGSGAQTTRSWTRSKLMPLISPRFSRAARTYGLSLAWDF